MPTNASTLEPSAAGVAELDIDIESDTVWQEVFDTLTASEQTCTRGALGDKLESSLRQLVVSDYTAEWEEWEVSIFSCLVPETARAVLLGGMISTMLGDSDVELSEAEASCLRELFADVDVAALVTDTDDPTAAMEVFFGTIFCFPALLLGEDVELSEDESACLRESFIDIAVAALIDASPDYLVEAEYAVAMLNCGVDDHVNSVQGATPVTVGEPMQGTLDYDGDEDSFAFEAEEGKIYQIDVGLGTLPDSELRLYSDGFHWASNVDSPGSRIVWKAPSSGEYFVEVGGYGVGSYTLTVAALDIIDDHANSVDGATPATVGEPMQGTLDYDYDRDFFAFEAGEGVLYQVDVELGTLPDSWLAIYDSDESEIAYNDDHEDSLASRITYWEAPSSGEYYAAVGGFGTGSYTLTVEALDIVDDHANSVQRATPATVGEPVQGALDYDGDNDVFAFEVEEGVLYQVDVELGTLPDSWLAIHDSDESEIAYNDDQAVGSPASRIVGEVPSSGEYFVEVGGYGVGSYTLTVAVSDIVDDHATNSVQGATPATVGEPVQGALDYDGDNDVFAFGVEEGVLYQINVGLGTLTDSWLAVYDSDESEIAYNDDDWDDGSPASRIVWEAPSSDEYFVVVGGYGVGSYMLTVEALDIVDDHANSFQGATPATVGEPVQGALDYVGDRDVFAFEVEEGVLYQVDVELGTLPDPRLFIYDSDEFWVDFNDDRDDGSPASRIVWEAPSSGKYYAVVDGPFDTGSYTLTVAVSDIADDPGGTR